MSRFFFLLQQWPFLTFVFFAHTLSPRTGGAPPRPGRVRHRGGAAGQGEAGEAVRAQEDQARGHDQAVAAGENRRGKKMGFQEPTEIVSKKGLADRIKLILFFVQNGELVY